MSSIRQVTLLAVRQSFQKFPDGCTILFCHHFLCLRILTMIDYPGMGGTARFAPEPNDSIRELRWKAESMLEYLRDHEAFLRQFPFPDGAVDKRLALWQSLAELLAGAMQDPQLSEDARLETHRVWGEEMHRSALFVVTMCVYARSEAARKNFTDDPELLEELIEKFERNRPAALKVLSTEDLNKLRQDGFLRGGE